jgi:phosphomevalonate kinase
MKIAAPGKLMLTGAYAVLHGAPAIVVAVDRFATADTDHDESSPTREVAIAFGHDGAPHVDASALFEHGRKLGLGSSAAVLVAALAARRAKRAADLSRQSVRSALFLEARAAHATSQNGGSGADVAASVFGGALRYSLSETGRAQIDPLVLPHGLHLAAFFSGTSARTTDLRAAVDALYMQSSELHRVCIDELRAGTELACDAAMRGRLDLFLAAAERTRRGLGMLGDAADAPVMPDTFVKLAVAAASAGAVFLPSGAGGGDVGVFLGREAPSRSFGVLASELGFTHVPLSVDPIGVRVVKDVTRPAAPRPLHSMIGSES